MASDSEGIGARIRPAKHQRGYSLRQLARALECSPSTLSQVERGLRAPDPELEHRLARWLDEDGPPDGAVPVR